MQEEERERRRREEEEEEERLSRESDTESWDSVRSQLTSVQALSVNFDSWAFCLR